MSASLLKILKVAVALIISICMVLFIRGTDFAQVARMLRVVGPGYLWILASTFCAYLFGTIGWQYCMGEAAPGISLWKLFIVRHVCETVSLFNPVSVIGGDMLKVVLLKKEPVETDVLISSVFISRLMMITTQVMLFVVSFAWLIFFSPKRMPFEGTAVYVVPGLVIITGCACYYFFIRSGGEDRMPAERPGKAPGFTDKIRNMRFRAATFYRNQPGAFALSFIFFSLHWLAGSLEFFIIIRLLGYNISLIHSLLIDMGVIIIKSAGAFIPGQVGIEEAGNRIMLLLAGFSSTTVWLAVSVLRRLRQLIWAFAGAVFYFFLTRRNAVTGG